MEESGEKKKISCKFCGHLQKVKSELVKCAVCLKRGFTQDKPQTTNSEEANTNH